MGVKAMPKDSKNVKISHLGLKPRSRQVPEGIAQFSRGTDVRTAFRAASGG